MDDSIAFYCLLYSIIFVLLNLLTEASSEDTDNDLTF